MNLLSAENLSVNFGDRLLFENLSFGLEKGDRIALIASNGTGKTTLLNILAGLESPDTGSVVCRDGVRVGYLRQDPHFDSELTIAQTIQQANAHIVSVIRQYHHAIEAQANDFSEEARKNVELLSAKMESLNAWDYERRMISILTRLQVYMPDKKTGELSGGQIKRLALAAVLIDSPDILLLDEPTNHMDIDMIEWLEDFLTQPGTTVFMVSHDRYFLDNVCTRIIEMEDNGIYHHKGNYVYYLEKSQARKAVFDTEIAKARQLYKKELEWMRTQPRARTHKSKSRVDSFFEIEKKANSKLARQDLKLDMKMSRLGNKILELRNVSKAYGPVNIMENFSYTFKKGDRIGIAGNNGTGKTTFLNILTGLIEPDAGRVIKGDTIQFGYFKQEGLQFDEDAKVIDIVKDIADVIVLADGTKVSAGKFLEFFLFPPKMQQNQVSKLSGGEKRRLHLLTVLVKNPNFLILDEPTNDLDLPTLNTLEVFLRQFGGCLILVSHDRYFLDTLSDHLFVFQGNGNVQDFYDTYSAYREKMLQDEKTAERQEKKSGNLQKVDKLISNIVQKPTWKENREFETLENEIEQLESEKQSLEAGLQQFAADAEKVMRLSERYSEVIRLIDQKTIRWIELSELIEAWENSK